MPVLTRGLATGAVVVALLLGASACGGGDDTPAKAAPSATASASPTAFPPDPLGSISPSAPAGPTAGVPADFPTQAVPLVEGDVTTQFANDGAEGRKGWVLQVTVAKTKQQCFDAAAAKLVAQGYKKAAQQVFGDTIQAQYTSSEYAVIISARTTAAGACDLGYEVGQVSR